MGLVIGLMSGTSLDGVDVALVKIDGYGIKSKVELIDFLTVPFTLAQRERLQAAMSLTSSNVQLICSLNFELGEIFGQAALKICEKNKISSADLSVIGSHGQTLYHQPLPQLGFVPSTLQIGEPAVIAYLTHAPVISNFRTMDMAAGGLGAPLVPYTEWLLYRHETKTRLLQNIGGIGNVTVMPASARLDDVWAFDTGPGNMIIDEVCLQLFGKSYDEGGQLAAQGHVHEEVLSQLMNMEYLKAKPPKTTGRELFGKAFVNDIIETYRQMDKHDLLATVTMFTAKTIAYHYETFIFPTLSVDEVILGGGGSYNDTLVNMLKELLSHQCDVFIGEEIGYSSDAKEAVAFALLANETLHQVPSNVPGATGARQAVILGNMTYPPLKKGDV